MSPKRLLYSTGTALVFIPGGLLVSASVVVLMFHAVGGWIGVWLFGGAGASIGLMWLLQRKDCP